MNLQLMRYSYSSVVAVTMLALTALLGLHHGGYYLSWWGPLAVLLAAMVVVTFGSGSITKAQLGVRSSAALIALTAFTIWSFVGVGSADNSHLAWEAAVLTAGYLSCVVLGLAFSKSRTAVHIAAYACVAGSAIVALWQVIKLEDDAKTLIFDGRLIGTFGYYNSQAAFLVIAFWASVVLASREARPWWERIACSGASALFLLLAVVPQSRGALVAFAGSVLLYFLISPIRVRSIPWFAVPVALTALHWDKLTSIYPATQDKGNVEGAIQTVQHTILFGVVAAAIVGGLIMLAGRYIPINRQWERHLRLGGTVALIIGLMIPVAGAAANHAVIKRKIDKAWSAFQKPPDLQSGENRFASVSNNGRLELWRVARKDFSENKLSGVGGGNWEATYYMHRKQNAGFVRQPHNLALEILSERGIVGASLLLLFFIVVFVHVGALLRADVSRDSRAFLALFAVVIAYWLAHSQIEWFWQFPAVTGVVFVFCGLIIGAPWRINEETSVSRIAQSVGMTVGVATLILTIPLVMSDRWLSRARAALPVNAKNTIKLADKANSFDSTNADIAYIKAAALTQQAKMDPKIVKRAVFAIHESLERNPKHWRSWVLAARLYSQLGLQSDSQSALQKAHSLNPLQPDGDFVEGSVAPGLENAP